MAQAADSTKKVEDALALLNEAAKEKKEELRGLLHDKYSELDHLVTEVEGEVAHRVAAGRQKAGEFKGAAEEKAHQVVSSVDRKIHDDPWKIMGYVAGGAFLLGFLFGHKD